MLLAGIFAALVFLYAAYSHYHKLYDPDTIFGLYMVAVVALLMQMYKFQRVMFTVNNDFSTLSRLAILFTAVNAVGSIVLVIPFKMYGVIIALVLTYIISVLYSGSLMPEKYSFELEFGLATKLIVVGIPIMLFNLLYKFSTTIDRLMILHWYNTVQVGYYSIGSLVCNYIIDASIVVGTIFRPRIAEKYGREQNIKTLGLALRIPTFVLSCATCILIGGAYFFAQFVIQHPLNKYMPALVVVPILIFGTYFLTVTISIGYYVISINRTFSLITCLGICALSNFFLNYYFLSHGWGIRGVALGTSISYFIYGVLITTYWLKQCRDTVKEIISDLCFILLPFTYTIFGVYIVSLILPSAITSLWHDLFLTAVRIAFFALLTTPLIIYINAQTKVIPLVINAVITRLKRIVLKKQ
jgi:O-antigen/teichoic acid export membrane protein